jgi:hypothetical protein
MLAGRYLGSAHPVRVSDLVFRDVTSRLPKCADYSSDSKRDILCCAVGHARFDVYPSSLDTSDLSKSDEPLSTMKSRNWFAGRLETTWDLAMARRPSAFHIAVSSSNANVVRFVLVVSKSSPRNKAFL